MHSRNQLLIVFFGAWHVINEVCAIFILGIEGGLIFPPGLLCLYIGLDGNFIYNMPCSEEDYEKLVPGTKIKVTGYKAEWSGEIEVADVSSFEIEDGEYIAEPLDVTDLLGKDELIDHQNELVSFKGMTVEAAGQDADGNDVAYLYNYDGSGSEGDDLYFNVSLNGETYTFTVESYLCDKDSDVYALIPVQEAFHIDLIANVQSFYGFVNIAFFVAEIRLYCESIGFAVKGNVEVKVISLRTSWYLSRE